MYTLLATTISSIQRGAPTPPLVTTNLQIHYDFTDPNCYSGSGNVVQDLTANNRDLVFVNTPSWGGNHLIFDGANDYGNIQNISSVNTQGAVGYWIRLTDNLVTTLTQRISGINGSWEFGRLDCAGNSSVGCTPSVVPNGSIGFDLGGANNITTNAQYSFVNTTWAYLVGTWEVGGDSRMYVNGVLVHSCAPGTIARTGTWSVGRSPGNTSRYYKGRLGWMTYYDRQLTDAEVLQNFNATKVDYGY